MIGSTTQSFVIKSYSLIALTLATVMFSRVLTATGAPRILDFFHFIIVPLVFILLCLVTRPQLLGAISGMFAFALVILVSALVNSAGMVNVVLDFLLLIEPFLLLLAIVSVRWSSSSIKQFRLWLLLVVGVHVALAFSQRFVLGLTGDDVKGVFLDMEAGHHVAGAVALTAAVYFLVAPPVKSMWIRVPVAVLCAAVVVLSDAKQVIAVFLVSLLALGLIKWRNVGAAFRYGTILVASAVATVLSAITIFPQLTNWTRMDQIIAGLEQKSTVFPIIASFYNSPLNWLFGLGPGHTIGRLGWLLPDYSQYLRPLGATSSPVTQAILRANETNWLSNPETGSSVWSLMFSWAGVWGDLGLVGVGTYLVLWWFVWRKFCLDDLSKFFVITILVFGVTFSWMEEPGYMLFVVSLIGLRWQEYQSSEKRIYRERPENCVPSEPRITKTATYCV